ncbi:M20/M25/M40 family metallo-hydrolase [Amorphus coralli]|uniref:M20/M25/M40 family metallo-hydrolase n=1 Tax=Amorphus coralli TaxID=340680 RepID=UPI00037356BB|nr:M20/M25/M40 family metallo-hydrolase [Amorphus coralli]
MIETEVDSRFEDAVAFLQALIRVPSENPPGDCAEAADQIAELYQWLGFTVEHHPVPDPFVRQYGMRSATNLVVRRTFGDGSGPTIALSSHADVVPPGEGWNMDPYAGQIQGQSIYGRGANDAKGDLATYAFALKALEADAEARGANGTVELHISFDEAVGGFIGPQWLLGQGLSAPDYAICAGFVSAVTTAHNGCLHLEVVVRGRSAHAAVPEAGRDALEAATPILAALYAERKRLADVTSAEPGIGAAKLTVGTIAGGLHTNVVPDRVVMRIDRRLIPEETPEAVEEGLTALVLAAAGEQEGIEVECRRVMLAGAMRPVAGVDRLVEPIRAHAEAVLGEAVPVTGAPVYTSARHYAAAGVPTVLYGASAHITGETDTHAADEYLRLDHLRTATTVVALALADLLGARRD